MSDDVVILYGSRARGDAGPGADVDLMLATAARRPQTPVERMGVSLHRYPRTWLLERARQGDLFAYHVGHEGVPLQDGDGFLLDLRGAFRRRETYVDDSRTGLLVARMLAEGDWGMDVGLRRRFFWGVRTCIISLIAAHRSPLFAAQHLEAATGIDGFADLMSRRHDATFAECRILATKLQQSFPEMAPTSLRGESLRLHLTALGGFPAECARAMERRLWEDSADPSVYA